MSQAAIDRHAIERICQDPAAVQAAFQSIIDVERDRRWGYELLANITGPVEAPSSVWFTAAAEYGLEGALEARVLRTGLSALGQLAAEESLAINVTPRALRSPQLQTHFREDRRFDSAVLEISESHAGEEHLAASLEPFRAAGGRVAVDSFAGGPTWLRGIAELRPDILKLDRSLVSRIDADPAKAVVADVVVELGKRLEAVVIAVGVERQEELDALRRLGITLIQGFLLGRRYPSLAAAQGR
jgi:EAL domain-containing protein (putative c-di-GMP-specific phosphodiesterase class I)